jgi:hypothetical protein
LVLLPVVAMPWYRRFIASAEADGAAAKAAPDAAKHPHIRSLPSRWLLSMGTPFVVWGRLDAER